MRSFVFVFALLLTAPLSAEPVRVLVSIAPVATMVEQVGGDAVSVTTLLPPGADPHHYAPTPRRIRALADAQLLVWAGAPYEGAWQKRAATVAAEAVQLMLGKVPAHHGHHHHHHEHDEDDPHRWTSPAQLRDMAESVRDQLIALRPDQAMAITARQRAFDRRLEALQGNIRAWIEARPQRHFLVFHPSWGHFAEEFGLTQLAIEHHGKVPGARALAKRIDQARELGIKRVFVQPQFDRRAAATVAEALGADIVEIDPLAADMLHTLSTLGQQLAGAGVDD